MLRLAHVTPLGILVLIVMALGGCSTQALRVDCEKRLLPINAPTPKPAAVSPDGGRQ